MDGQELILARVTHVTYDITAYGRGRGGEGLDIGCYGLVETFSLKLTGKK